MIAVTTVPRIKNEKKMTTCCYENNQKIVLLELCIMQRIMKS